MSGTIRRDTLRETLADGIDLGRLEDDPRTAALPLERADRNGDGRIEGDRELDALFAALDALDGRRDGGIRSAARDGTATPVAPALGALADFGDVAALRAVASAGDPRHAIAVVGLTEASADEARALARRAPVLYAGDLRDGRDTVLTRDGTSIDLSSADGPSRHARSLGLPHEVADRVARAVEHAKPGARRELAVLASIWADAYRGELVPPRLLVSGHGDGTHFFEQDDDELARADVIELARAMPRSAEQVRAIHLAACQHGYEERMREYLDAFPALDSIWGYAAFSPSGVAAERHQAIWEARTRALPEDGGALSPADAAGTRRGAGVAVWTRAHGWMGPAQRPLAELYERWMAGSAEATRYFRGEAAERWEPSETFLAERYQLAQQIVAHLDFADQSETFRERRARGLDETLRLRFFHTNVAPAFDRVHRGAIEAGYAAVGMDAPRFAGMTRAACLAEIERFGRAVDGIEGAVPVEAERLRELLENGLRDLRPEVIPLRWL